MSLAMVSAAVLLEEMGFDVPRLLFLRWLVRQGRNPETEGEWTPRGFRWKAEGL